MIKVNPEKQTVTISMGTGEEAWYITLHRENKYLIIEEEDFGGSSRYEIPYDDFKNALEIIHSEKQLK